MPPPMHADIEARLAGIEATLAAIGAHLEHLRADIGRLPDRAEISEIIDAKTMRCAQQRDSVGRRTPAGGVPRPAHTAVDWMPLVKGAGLLFAGIGAALAAMYGASLVP